MQQKEFREWCLVELFGHQRVAGLVSEQTLGGASFVRVDIPETMHQSGFTRLFGAAAIYSITPVEESIARIIAEQTYAVPVQQYELRQLAARQERPVGDGGGLHDVPPDEDYDADETDELREQAQFAQDGHKENDWSSQV